MKHHFADFLDRNGDYWTIVPNIERYSYTLDEKISDVEKAKVVTISKEHENWKQIFELPNLEELTLHEPSKEQLESIITLTELKRLRVTHARTKNIDFMSGLISLEECVFEYFSGFSDLSPLNKLPKLKSLHFENLRKVSDFNGLIGSKTLKYLYINGTLDWNQPIDNFEFLSHLESLEVIHLVWINNKTEFPALYPLINLKNLKRITINRNTFKTDEYALIETALPAVDGIKSELCWEYGDRIEFLGKKAGWISVNSPNKEAKCLAFEEKYSQLILKAADLIKQKSG
jgi:hypothetical protein